MNFSNFLNILFDKTNRDTTNKKLFVIELFDSTGTQGLARHGIASVRLTKLCVKIIKINMI